MNEKRKVLVADDSLTIRKLTETVLRQEGYEVVLADTGRDCLAKAKEHGPVLILLDYVLPDMQGTEVCQALINSPETWEIPVLLMSSNGNAIRQLYQDLNNVADYLTKPFAPNVLKAVMGHILDRGRGGGEGSEGAALVSGGEGEGAGGVARGNAGGAEELMGKVTRLLSLLEKPGVEGQEAGRVEERREVLEEDWLKRLLEVFRRCLRGKWDQIPAWEDQRRSEDFEGYYGGRFFGPEMLDVLRQEVLGVGGVVKGGHRGAFRCELEMVGLDQILKFLESRGSSGELLIELGEERVEVWFWRGEVVYLSSNHPRNYCSGSSCNFHTLPHTVIGLAVKAQQSEGIPFFVTLARKGHLERGEGLDDLLKEQGGKALARAFVERDATAVFWPRERLPEVVEEFQVSFSMGQLLLGCYRMVEDWFTIGEVVPSFQVRVVLVPEEECRWGDLEFNEEEREVVEGIGAADGPSIQDLEELTGLKPFDLCRILYRLVRLGLVRMEAAVGTDMGAGEVADVALEGEEYRVDLGEPDPGVNGNHIAEGESEVMEEPRALEAVAEAEAFDKGEESENLEGVGAGEKEGGVVVEEGGERGEGGEEPVAVKVDGMRGGEGPEEGETVVINGKSYSQGYFQKLREMLKHYN